jgi:hypothetical protein
VVVGGIVLAGCQNLNLPDVNAVTLQQSLGSAGTMEETVASATKFYMGVLEGYDVRQGVSISPSLYMSAVDEEITAESDVGSMFTFSGFEPRNQFSNQNANPSWLNRIPSQTLGTVGAMCNNVLVTLKAGVIKIGTVSAAVPQGTHTNRDQWWCEFLIGSGNIYRGIMFDQGIPSPDTTPINNIIALGGPAIGQLEVAHDSVINFGIGQTEHAIQMTMAAIADTTSNVWINGVSYNNTDAAKIMYSTLARSVTMAARNTEERATLPVGTYTWNNVITWIDSGMTAGSAFCNGCPNWSVDGQPTTFSQPGGLVNQGNSTVRGAINDYLMETMVTGSSSTGARISPRFLGPWDTTGAWQWWLHGSAAPPGPSCANGAATTVCDLNDTGSYSGRTDTTFGSPDKRINAYVAGVPQKGSLKNTDNGLYFGRFRCDGTTTTAVGTASTAEGAWAQSNYIFFRYPSGIAGVPTQSGCQGTTTAAIPYEAALYSDMSPEEMNFLLAEAYIRTGSPALALPIINSTRVTVGGLPAATVTGVPATAGCVPRNEDNTCTNLMMTMFYEKRMEMIGENELTDWTDWRAFGKMLWGSMIQMPPEARELVSVDLPIYTYGGNSPGSAYVPCTGIVGSGLGCVSIYP